jgi:hypothetical protein
MFVSVDEMAAWHGKGWLSFDPAGITQCDDKERVEVRFVKGIAHSGLSDAMVDRLLSRLERPYCYDPAETFFSFVDDRWVSLPPQPDESIIADQYIDGLAEGKDWEALQKLQNKITDLLESAEAAHE